MILPPLCYFERHLVHLNSIYTGKPIDADLTQLCRLDCIIDRIAKLVKFSAQSGIVRGNGVECREYAVKGLRMKNHFKYFKTSPEIIRLVVMPYVRFPLSLRQVEELLHERGVDVCYETVRLWWNRFGPLFAAEMRTRRIHHGSYSNWRWHLDEVFVRINGETCYLWRAVDHEGEVLEVVATKRRDRRAALEFLKRTMKRYGRPASIVTDRLPSYRAAMKVIGNEDRQETKLAE